MIWNVWFMSITSSPSVQVLHQQIRGQGLRWLCWHRGGGPTSEKTCWHITWTLPFPKICLCSLTLVFEPLLIDTIYFPIKKTNNTNEVIFIQTSDISLAVILFYGIETHAEINRLPHRKRLFTGTVPLIHFVLIGAVPIKKCWYQKGFIEKSYSQKATIRRLLIKGFF